MAMGQPMMNRARRIRRLAVLDQDRLDGAGGVGFDLVHELHGFDDAQDVAHGDGLADFDEGLAPGALAR
jgi:hypothetical protein